MSNSDNAALTCVYDLAPDALEDEVHGQRTLRGLARVSGDLWAYGDRVLLVSQDGLRWTSLASELNLIESFSVNAVVGDERGVFIFARCRNGLLCYRLAQSTWKGTRLPSLPTGSPDALAARIDGAVLVCVNEGRSAQFMRLGDSEETWVKLQSSLPGVPVHFEMSNSKVGLCALWGIREKDDVAPSAVYRTEDGGTSWSRIQEMDTMLLGGASDGNGSTLLGGTDGYIASGTVAGFRECSERCADEVAAVTQDSSQQAAVLGSDEDPVNHTILWRSCSSVWKRFAVAGVDRINHAQVIRFGVILFCTQRSLLLYRVEVPQ